MWYRVRVCASQLETAVDGERFLGGFVTIRIVEAAQIDQAGRAAVEMVLALPQVQALIGSNPSVSLTAESIEPLGRFERLFAKSTGLVFYKD